MKKIMIIIMALALAGVIFWSNASLFARQDPLRIITSQSPKPNALFVITRTTAMAGDTHGHGNIDPQFCPADCHETGSCPGNKQVCCQDGVCRKDQVGCGDATPDCHVSGCPTPNVCNVDGVCRNITCPDSTKSCRFEFRPTIDAPGVFAFVGHCTGSNCTTSYLAGLGKASGAGIQKPTVDNSCISICHSNYTNALILCGQGNDSCISAAYNTFETCVNTCWTAFTNNGSWGSGDYDIFEAGALYSNGHTHDHKEGEIGGAHMKLWRPYCWIPFGATAGAKGTLCWPSRMAIIKWILGDSMKIVPPEAMVNANASPTNPNAYRRRTHSGNDHYSNPDDDSNPNNNCEPENTPFGMIGCKSIEPRQLVNTYYNKMNIGLATFSSLTGVPDTDGCSQGQNIGPYENLLIRLNPSDSDVEDVNGECDTPSELAECANGIKTCPQKCIAKAFNEWMKSARQGGLNAGGRTPLGQALSTARKYLIGENTSGPILDDPLKECRRKFVVLLTHGEHNYPDANTGNPADVALTEYAPAINANPLAAVRGIIVAFFDKQYWTADALQMNKTACWAGIMSSKDDGGVDLVPKNTGGTLLTDYPNHNCDVGWNTDGTHGADHHDHAYFAKNALEMAEVFEKVFAAIALTGDFVVSQPVAAQISATSGSLLLASTTTPAWKGTLRRWDMFKADGGANHVPAKLSTLCSDINDPAKIVSAGNPNDYHFHLIWDAGCSLKDQYNPSTANHDRKIYTVATSCNVGSTISGPSLGCKDMKAINKSDASIVNWIRNKITNVNWANYDFDKDGNKADIDNDDILMLLDFILGGNGSNIERDWLLGDIINGTPVVIGKPMPYSIVQNIPPKGSFDAAHYSRQKIVYLPANDGMLHALRFNHNPKDPSSPKIEEFAFLPPTSFPKVIQMFQNYLDALPDTSYPTGQSKIPDFDNHIWSVSAPPSYADVWINWKSPAQWRTILFLPLGPTTNGVYALDVTDPTTSTPPFDVVWYWNGTDKASIPAGAGKEVWNAIPIGLSQEDGKGGGSYPNAYEKWVVGFASTHASDADGDDLIVVSQADTGETKYFKVVSPAAGDSLVPFHIYANAAFMESDYEIYMPDALVSHMFVADTDGRIHATLLNNDNSSSWGNNTPEFPLNFGDQQPIYFEPAIAHGVQTSAMVLATSTGSIFETEPEMNGAWSTYKTKLALDLLDIDQTTKNVEQHDNPPGTQHKEWTIAGTYNLDTDGDGTPDTTVNISGLSRASGRPFLKIKQGKYGYAYYLIFDPQVYNPELGICTGKTYLFSMTFQLDPVGNPPPGGAGAAFSNVIFQPLTPIGYGVVTGVAAGVEKIITGLTGYGAEGVAVPEILPINNPISNVTIPKLRGMKKAQ